MNTTAQDAIETIRGIPLKPDWTWSFYWADSEYMGIDHGCAPSKTFAEAFNQAYQFVLEIERDVQEQTS